MKTYFLPDDLLTEPIICEEEIIIRLYQSNHKTLKNKIILNRNMINLLINGNKTVDYPESSVEVKAGELILLSTGNILTSEVTSDQNEFTSILIYFSNEMYNRFWIKYEHLRSQAKQHNGKPYLIYQQDSFIQQYINSLFILLKHPDLLTAEIRQLKMEELMLYLLQSDPEKLQSFRIVTQDRENLQLKRVVERYIGKPTTIDELAFLCNMSTSTFKRRFEHLYNTSPQKWLLNKRMELSADLLRSSDTIPSQVFYRVGYQNHSSFSEAFRKHFGITPSQYHSQYLTVRE
ncbi:helix-turn-helix domain-containing protein [Chryseobacterium sp. Mn2064]|uniref:helix-turn-helix domain-containing protein n=1 Tax=Chryseobacterium sp. Mn2064 TaxID=3395263 RepID=UPI003BBAA5A0